MIPYRANKENNPQLTLQQEQKLYQLYEKDHIGAFDAYKSCKNVVVFGEPHRGKSTVINSLLGHKLKSVPDPHGSGAFRVDLVNPDREPQLEISYNRHYCPKHTELTPTQGEDVTIWECPTLCKNIDDKMQMDEFPKVMQLLKTLDSVKFIYVTQHDEIFWGCRGQNFSFAVDVVARIFSNIDIIEKSILLVVTKAPPGSSKQFIADRIYEMAHVHEIPENTKTMMKYFKASSIYVFSTPEREDEEVEGPTMEDIAGLSFCNVTQSIQYPRLSEPNQELAIQLVEEDKAQKQLEQVEVDTKNISNAGFFIKVVDFLYEILSEMSILSKAGQYAGGILMAFSSLIGINNFKNYFSSNKMEAVSEKDYSLQPMSPEKAKLAKCLVKILNDNEELSKEFNQKFTECIEQYTHCKNDEEKQSIVKQFSEWIISETNLKNELLTFEAELQLDYEGYNSSGKGSSTKFTVNLPDIVRIKSDFAKKFKNVNVPNPNIPKGNAPAKQTFYDEALDALAKIITVPNTVESEGEAATEQALHDATSDETLDKEIHNIVESEGGGGDNLTSDDKNSAYEPQEDNTTETNNVDEREGDGYDAGMRLGGEVNNQW